MERITKTIINALFALIVVTAVGCSASAHIEKDNAVNFNQYRTFGWAEEKTLKDRNSNDIIDAKLKAEVAKYLEKNGWRESKNKPDVILDYNIVVEKNIREDNKAVYSQPYTRFFYNPYTRRVMPVYYPAQIVGYETYEIPVKEGTLTLHMIDNKTNKLVWQGWTSDEITERQISSKDVLQGVNNIMKKFKIEG